jgi:[calcium/calmodulin-dependent protein kinase] kinase
VTNGGAAPLLSAEENCAILIEAPNELELNRAITRKMNHLLCVMKVIHRFKTLLAKNALKRTSTGDSFSSVHSSLSPAEERARAEEIEAIIAQRKNAIAPSQQTSTHTSNTPEPSQRQPLILGIGTGARDAFAQDDTTFDIVADSPTAVDFDVYDRAYQEAVERHIKSNSTEKPTMYLTKFVRDTDHFRGVDNIVDGTNGSSVHAEPNPGLSSGADKLAHLTSQIVVSGSPEK